MNEMKKTPYIWLISGCSSGFGREIALQALSAGDFVGVSSRNVKDVEDICKEYPKTALPIKLDVTNKDEIKESIQTINKVYGGFDVFLKNDGYSFFAALGGGEKKEGRKIFVTNFFGALELTKAALPGMRAQRFGRIINNSSQAGIMANPGTGYYSASKYALEGLMEALDKELRPLNISVTSVQPGAFRTDWSGRSMKRSIIEIDDYSEHVKQRIDMIGNIDGKQPGDPVRAAKIIFALSRDPNPPDKLLLGAGVLSTYKEKLSALLNQIDEFEETSISADFPQINE